MFCYTTRQTFVGHMPSLQKPLGMREQIRQSFCSQAQFTIAMSGISFIPDMGEGHCQHHKHHNVIFWQFTCLFGANVILTKMTA